MNHHALIDVDDVPAYVAGRPALAELIDPGRITRVREVGDGNMNQVFVVEADGTNSAGGGLGGLVLKQAPPYVRVDPTWPVTPGRSGLEANALAAHGAAAPGYVPVLYDVDEGRHIIAMEDLSDHRVWRGELNEGLRHEGAAEDVGRYVAKVTFGTSIFGMDPADQKAALTRAVNPELCKITEDLVFTEPYIRHEHNSVLPVNEPDVAAYAGDPEVVAAIGMAKLSFMTHAEALIHGDLHTGSVLVRTADGTRPRSTKAFDPEFAFYGPVGFDLGALWGNFVLAAARATVLGSGDQAAWVLRQASVAWDAFETEFRALWPGRVDPRVFDGRVLERFLHKVRADAAVFGAAKAARRIIGFSKVTDIETLPEERRAPAVRGALRSARLLAVEGPEAGDVAALFGQVGDILSTA